MKAGIKAIEEATRKQNYLEYINTFLKLSGVPSLYRKHVVRLMKGKRMLNPVQVNNRIEKLIKERLVKEISDLEIKENSIKESTLKEIKENVNTAKGFLQLGRICKVVKSIKDKGKLG